MNTQPITWDRSLFANAESPGRICPELIDLTGGARHVVFGPFIEVEAGRWRVTMDLELCPDAASRHLIAEFGGEGDFSSTELPYNKPGRRKISVIHTFESATVAEVRLLLAKAAFHGYLRFFGAEIERLDGESRSQELVATDIELAQPAAPLPG